MTDFKTFTRRRRVPHTNSEQIAMRTFRSNFILLALSALAISACPLNAEPLTVEQAEKYISPSFPNARVEYLEPAALPGVYEMVINGTVYYISDDGRFMISGTLYDLQNQTDLTERRYSQMRQSIVNDINKTNSISYEPADYQYTVSVFSDVDCPYCRKFHSQLAEVEALGIRVNYILTPYWGPAAYQNAVNVWCAEDRQTALTQAKSGQSIEKATCEHPIDNNLSLAKLAGVNATPSFLLSDGRLLSGYRQPLELLEEIKKVADKK